MNHHTKHRKWIFSCVVVILTLAVVTPALADYIGPNRTRTETVTVCHVALYECQFVEAKGEWRYKQENTWSCSLESKPWQAYSNRSRPCNDTLHSPYQYWERDESTRTQTNTYPPATINSSLQNCTMQNGWCITAPHLALSGSEPVAGQYIYAIEGFLNGQPFGCTSSSCNVPLNQGSNNFSYWALSSFEDSSAMGTFTAKVDSQLPNIAGTLSGTTGSNGWYTGPITFNGSATDATSGVASFTCSLDGATLGACNTIPVNSDGLHTIALTARDNAGLTRTITQNASIDTQNPALNASISGTLGSNNWYTDARLTAAASDPSPGSGLSALEYSVDGTGWTRFPTSGTLDLIDGQHTVDLRAVDQAGRAVSASKSFWLDTTFPSVTLDSDGTVGLNGWYITSPTLAASANDDISGMDVLDYSLDNGEWQSYRTPLTLSDGVHNVAVWAQDAAGLVTQIEHTYQVDTRLPQIAGSLSGTPGTNGWYVSDVTLSVSASDPTPGSGIDTFTYILDESAEIPYTDPLLLSDGKHTVQFVVKDKAGLSYAIEQNINVDTTPSSLQITTPPAWVKGTISLDGTATDDSSGLSGVEISIDGGQTWQNTTSADANAWNYTWNTQESTNGFHQINVRATDLAGLSTQQTLNVGVDNGAPEISLPDSWFQWDTVKLDIWDRQSGLAEASVEITDPNGPSPTRVIQLDPNQFPLIFKWDRRLGDDTLAKPGTYDVKIIAVDNLGNSTSKSASIKILLDILPAGPTSTTLPYTRAEPTPTPVYMATVVPSPITTKTAIVSVFGVIEPTVSVPPTPQLLPTPRATPTQTNMLDLLQSVFVPNENQESTIEIGLSEESKESAQPPSTKSNTVLWGAAATAAIAAATAYVQEENRKREEEEARRAELEAEAEERREKMKERKLEKMETKRAQEQAWEEARIQQESLEGFQGLAARARLKNEVTDWEMQEEANWVASQAAIRERYEEKKKKDEEKKKAEELQARLESFNNARKEREQEAPNPESNWWEKTKSFINENIIQPVNTYVYEPYIKPGIEVRKEIFTNVVSWSNEYIYQPMIEPALERTKEFITNEFAWMDEHIYQPVIKPIGEKINNALSEGITWANEKVYQPHIKPIIEKTIQDVSNDIKWLNEKVYQPYIQPVVEVINKKVYQPYIQPVVQRNQEFIANEFSWIQENIYEPIIEPVVKDINQYIYQPIAKKVNEYWDEYGEWVHGALDVVGFIPGLGEIADGINGLIYLGEGRYLEGSLSLISAIPVLGYFGNAGKWTLNAVNTAVDKVVKEVAGDAIQKTAKELLEEGTEKIVKETSKPLITDAWVQNAINVAGCIPGAGTTTTTINTLIDLSKGKFLDATISTVSMIPIVGDIVTTGKKVLDGSLERLLKEATEEMRENVAKESFEAGSQVVAKEVKEEVVEKTTRESSEALVTKSAKETSEEFVETTTKASLPEKVVKEASEDLAEKTTKETFEEGIEKGLKEVGEEVAEVTTKDVFEETVEITVSKVQKELKEDAFIENGTHEDADKDAEKIIEDPSLEKSIEEAPQQIDESQFINSLREQYGDEMVDSFLPFCDKYGINPHDVLTRPPAEGQTLIGWGLGIENPANPVNHPLVNLNLTRAELDNILIQSTVRSDSEIVVLGYGGGVAKPYYALSDEINGCHLSLPANVWAPFENARANFWVDINTPFVEKAIENRKIFLFNIEYDVIINPRNEERFSLPELRLIEMEKNGYVQVPVGEYTAFVPNELLDTYEQYLPANLLA